MHNIIYKICFAVLLSQLAANVYAADINAGKSKAAICQACHGSVGISNNPLWPNLAGQSSAYLEVQLKNFKSEVRLNPIMKPIADGLNDTDIQNLAAYFSSLPGKPSTAEAVVSKQGKEKTAMCMGCHGENLLGKALFPKLAGQQSQYLYKQLQDFKNGARKAMHMNAIAQSLSDEDAKIITAYIANLPN